jgi:hypothetical protein
MIDHCRTIRLFSIMLLMTIGAAIACAEETTEENGDSLFLGIWSTHYQQTFITLVINRDRTAQFLLIGPGHSIGTVNWRPAPNGLIVDSLPRFRLWGPSVNDRVRAEMEPLPPEMTNVEMQRFPLAFYLKRQRDSRDTTKQFERPLPDGWRNHAPPPDFDEAAGQPRVFAH